MSDLVARTGRLQQRYDDGCRLVAREYEMFANKINSKGYFYGAPISHRCIPFRYVNPEVISDDVETNIEVLMINSQSGPGLLFPKGGWENDETVEEAAVREAVEEAGVRGDLMELLGYYKFKSKTHQDEYFPQGLCKAAMFALQVEEELVSWPEQSTRNRFWLTVPEADKSCRHAWMRAALSDGFLQWHAQKFPERQDG